MPTPVRYLVELRPSENGFEDIQLLGAGSRAASEELSRNGTPVRFLRSVFLLRPRAGDEVPRLGRL